MEILALEGGENTGKSETLNIVYQFLLSDSYTQVRGHFKVLGNPNQKDFIDILEKGNNRIGIVTQGDYVAGPNSIANHLNILFLAGCTKAICACTNKNAKARLQVSSYPIHTFYPKSVTSIESDRRIFNNIDANTIFSHI